VYALYTSLGAPAPVKKSLAPVWWGCAAKQKGGRRCLLERAARQCNLAQGGKSEVWAAFGGREGGTVNKWCGPVRFQGPVLVEIDHSKSKTDHQP
jgi:hypothetical protein